MLVIIAIYWCVLNVGLLGVAGMMKLIVSQWIIPENSLLRTMDIIDTRWCPSSLAKLVYKSHNYGLWQI